MSNKTTVKRAGKVATAKGKKVAASDGRGSGGRAKAAAPAPRKAAKKVAPVSKKVAPAAGPAKKGAAGPAKKGAAGPAKKPEVADSFAPIIGSEKEFIRFQAAAAAVDPRDIIMYRTDATLIFHNVSDGLDSLGTMRERIAKELPLVRFELLAELPALALGLDYAVRQVKDAGARAELPSLLAEASELRDPMLAGAVALAKAKLLPKGDVDRIFKGTGFRDRAKDCIDLSSLFRKHWANIEGKTAITLEQLARAAEVGTALLRILKPRGAHRRRTAEQQAPAEQRDRLFTVIVQRHDQMRRIGVWLWGEAEVDEYIPALGSRKRTRRRKNGKDDKKDPNGKDGKPA
jgi:hypothetical protein